MSSARLGSIGQITALLQQVYPGAHFSERYLRWLYEQSPDGARDGADRIEGDRVVGHYALVPQVWRQGSNSPRLALVVNLAVSPNAARKGIANIFIRLGREAYARASTAGIGAAHGVANANSSLGVRGRLGMTLVTSLPVIGGVALPRPGARSLSRVADRQFLDSQTFERLVASIDTSSEDGFSQEWTAEKLRWRLSSPKTAYAVHMVESGALITCLTRHAGIPIAVALKYLPCQRGRSIKTQQLLSAAARFHHTPFYIYAGFNTRCHVPGVRLPQRFLPSPLNLFYLSLSASMPGGTEMRYAAFEFLDFDAY
jgi:hypothetical protein